MTLQARPGGIPRSQPAMARPEVPFPQGRRPSFVSSPPSAREGVRLAPKEFSGKMEMCRQESLSEGERAKASNPKLPASSIQKKARKKKKRKKKKKAAHENEKPPSRAKKELIFANLPLKLLCCQSYHRTPTKETANAKGIPGKTAGNPFSASAAAISLSAQGRADVANESLRWNGILEDPVAEEKRLWNYRLNRRKRYGVYMQQNLPLEPSATLQHSPQLGKAAQEENKQLLHKSKSSFTLATKVQSRPLSKVKSKIFKRQLAALQPSPSQETV